ncbi:hypothetical protein I302_103939 [Kwoniella bestiolae CBS 10118]|uniref:Uncharacterized protein n=1 Tax=Kwoniella bestiolae CBS 10118 TaxID=1296100 RepID=A0A1B9G9V4_9TREE|nr:hypothetical protein I302_02645 [Kwoniella bestiolae CBS 10118]OCF27796.1 hypothetical protein I302_02645 [Kwoniella bestiolae CBS 10118]
MTPNSYPEDHNHESSDEQSPVVDPAHIPLPPDHSDKEAPNKPKGKSKHSKKPKTKRWNKNRRGKKKDDTESHWFHKDSGAIITVRSEDNVKFEISKDKLGNVSKTFGVIFNESYYYASSSEPIYLPYPADTLSLFSISSAYPTQHRSSRAWTRIVPNTS